MARKSQAAEVGRGDRIVFAFSFGPFLGFWLALERALKPGRYVPTTSSLSSLARVRMILDTAASVLCCTPTYALRLAEVAGEEKLDLARSRRIIVAGKAGSGSHSSHAPSAEVALAWSAGL